jgi:tetratricopeptide (TPR) repeat protein
MNHATRSTILLLAAVSATSLAGCHRAAKAQRTKPAPTPPVATPASEANQALARAKLLADQGLPEVALSEFQRAIDINPTLTPAFIGMAEIHQKKGNLVEAESGYNRAAQLEPGNFRAQYGDGLMLQLLGRIGESVRAYLRALSISPNDFDANLNLATAYLQLGEGSSGLTYAQRAVRLNANSGPARVNLGAIYASLGEHDRAVTEYQQAAELMELTPELLLNLGESLGRTGKYAEMQAVLEQLVQKRASAPAYERLANSLFRQMKYPESLEAFRKALELDANYYPALNGIGVNLLNKYLESDKRDTQSQREAIEVLRRSLQIEPKQPAVVDLLARFG